MVMLMNRSSAFNASGGTKLSIRAAWGAYVALAGVWFVLGALFVLVDVSSGRGAMDGAFLPLAVGSAWVIWLAGFRLSISSDFFVYRDGFYRSIRVPVEEITAVRSTWIMWNLVGKELRLPRLVIDYGSDRHVVVNTKPFARQDIRSAIELIDMCIS